MFAYICDTATDIPKAARVRIERQQASSNVTLRMLDLKNYDADIRTLTEIFNDAWAGNWGFTPLTTEETAHLPKVEMSYIGG